MWEGEAPAEPSRSSRYGGAAREERLPLLTSSPLPKGGLEGGNPGWSWACSGEAAPPMKASQAFTPPLSKGGLITSTGSIFSQLSRFKEALSSI
jgi:hypothetical protein